MANRTVKDAHSVKGTNPQYLIEKIIRSRIYESKFWKEECFALSAELLVDKAMELRYVGGVYGGNIKITPFLCLILKMLQIQPEQDIVVEFIRNQDFKYVRALGVVYMRMTGTSLDCYKYLEPLYLDYRKLRRMKKDGTYEVIHMDEFIEEVLHEERVCDCIMPRIQKRQILEELNQLEARISALDDDLEDMEMSEEEEDDEGEIIENVPVPSPDRKAAGYRDWDNVQRSPSPRFRRSRSKSPHGHNSSRYEDRERRHGSRERERHSDHHRRSGRDREKGRDRDRKRRSRSKERERHRESGHKHRREDRGDGEDRGHHRSKKSKHDKKDRERKELPADDPDVREANELRAKLGMAPLRP